jgi:hypothetical protein
MKRGTSLNLPNNDFSNAFNYNMKPGLGSAIGLFDLIRSSESFKLISFLLIKYEIIKLVDLDFPAKLFT